MEPEPFPALARIRRKAVRFLLVLFSGTAIGMAPRVASAMAPAPEPIFISVPNPNPCTNEPAFFERVRGRTALVRAALPGEHARTIGISIEEGRPLRATLVIRSLDGTSARREIAGEDCAEVVDALSLIVALAIDPRAVWSRRESVPTDPAPESATTSSYAAPSTPSTALALEARPFLRSRLAVEGLAATGLAPTPLAGGGARWLLDRHGEQTVNWELSLGFFATLEAEKGTPAVSPGAGITPHPSASVRYQVVGGALEACPWGLDLGPGWILHPCIAASLHQLRAVSAGYIDAHSDSGLVPSVGATLRLSAPLSGRLSWTGSLTFGVPLKSYSIELEPTGERLDQVAPVTLMGSLGLALGGFIIGQ